MKILVLFLMLFLHIVDDYYLQGILASMKQKSWWQKNAPDDLYKKDYIVALICHSFSWAFLTTLPLYLFGITNIFVYIMFFINWIGHAVIDDLKANKKKINLIQDQSIHVIQIIIIYLCSFI